MGDSKIRRKLLRSGVETCSWGTVVTLEDDGGFLILEDALLCYVLDVASQMVLWVRRKESFAVFYYYFSYDQVRQTQIRQYVRV